ERPRERVQGARPDMGTGDKFKLRKRKVGDSPDKFFAKPERPKVERLEKEQDKRENRRFSDEDRPKRNYGGRTDDKRGDNDRPKRSYGGKTDDRRVDNHRPKRTYDKPERRADVAKTDSEKANDGEPKQEVMLLNKYVSHCGVCSRREAVSVIKEGKVKVNDETQLEPGYKVQLTDKVEYGGKVISSTRNLVYILLNKPKNYITTTDDPLERRTVMDLVADAG